MGFVAYLVLLVIGRDVFLIAQSLVSDDLFLGTTSSAVVIALSAVMLLAGFLQARLGPRIQRVDLPVAGLHPALDGLTIAQLSDVHIGPTLHKPFMRSLVDRTNALSPDLIAVTGDLVDGSVARIGDQVAPIADLRARLGTYFVTGNHEYYSDAASWCAFVTQQGLTVLQNEHRVVEAGAARLLIGGINDPQARGFGSTSDLAGSIAGAPAVDFKILLAHQPSAAPAAEAAGYDLQLSGHTHAGQFFPFNLIARLAHRYFKGLNRHGRMWVYVNSGTGFWGPPVRLGVPAEITLLTLRAV